MIFAPLAVANMQAAVNVQVYVMSGDSVRQAGAISLGITRALKKMNPDLRLVLKTTGLLTCDSRVHERKKSGQCGARKRFQFSKR
jgi:small subunit ribosomal protein S9